MAIPVEVSPIRAFQKCPKQYEYRYQRHLKPKVSRKAIWLGTQLHLAFEDSYTLGWDKALERIDTRWAEATDDQREEYGDSPMPSDVRRLVRSYRETYADDDWNILHVEHHMEGEIAGRHVEGTADVIAEIPILGEGLTIVDRKSTTRIPGTTVQLLDPQLALYAVMARELEDLDVRRVMFDYVVTKPPTKPKVVGLSDKIRKDGTFREGKGPRLSSLGSINTDEWTLLEAIRDAKDEHGKFINEEVYADDLKKLHARPMSENPFFRRVVTELTEPIARGAIREMFMMNELMEGTLRMVKSGTGVFPRHVGPFTCPHCEMRHLCDAELQEHPDDIKNALENFEVQEWSPQKEGEIAEV